MLRTNPHCKDKCRKFETNISRKGITGPQSQFPHSCVCERIIYYHDFWVCLFFWRKYVDRSWEYVNRSQTHECGNWGWGRAIPRKGIYKRYCRCSAGQLRLRHWLSDALTTRLDLISFQKFLKFRKTYADEISRNFLGKWLIILSWFKEKSSRKRCGTLQFEGMYQK